jgi:hypothetical protein
LDEDPIVAQVVGVRLVLEAETLVRLGARVRLLAGALPVGAASLASLVLPAGKTQTVVLQEEAKRVRVKPASQPFGVWAPLSQTF